MNKKQTVIISALSVACFVLALLISTRLWFRLDLTKGHAYTISKVSKDLSKEIPDEVRITYYVSEKLAKVHTVPGEIEDLLREYAAYSHGKIRFIMKDPARQTSSMWCSNWAFRRSKSKRWSKTRQPWRRCIRAFSSNTSTAPK